MKSQNNQSTVPEFLKGSNVDAKGLPLRMNIEGERRLDEPYRTGKKFKLSYTLGQGVVIEPTE
jgi:hypothetical protein